MGKVFLQLGLLIWKCWKSELRNPLRFAALILVPLLMFVILAGFRLGFELVDKEGECHFESKPLPSSGTVPYVQGVVCNYENDCQGDITRGERGEYPYGKTL